MEARTVKKGKHKYRPGYKLGIGWTKYGYSISYCFPNEAWKPPRLNAQGENAEQWSKLGGVSFFNGWPWTWWPPNARTALVAFRPSKLKNHFEIAAYVNHKTWLWEVQPLLTAPAESEGLVRVLGMRNGDWGWTNTHEGKEAHATIPVKAQDFQFNISPWYGGQKPAHITHQIKTEML